MITDIPTLTRLRNRITPCAVVACLYITLASCFAPTQLTQSRGAVPELHTLVPSTQKTQCASNHLGKPATTQARKVVLIFTGLFGHKYSCHRIGMHLAQHDFHCIFISHQPLRGFSYYGILDDWSMAKFNKRLGWGSIASQATDAYQRVKELLTTRDELYLLCHSQGALVGLAFWHRYRHLYHIRAMSILAAPLQGTPVASRISNPWALFVAQWRAVAAGWRAPCYASYILPHLVGIYTGIFAPIMLPGFVALHPGSSALARLHKVYRHMAEARFPVLAIVAHCPPYRKLSSALYGGLPTEHLMSNSVLHDGLVPADSQSPPMIWPALQITSVVAKHSGVKRSDPLPSVYNHPEVIAQITAFFEGL